MRRCPGCNPILGMPYKREVLAEVFDLSEKMKAKEGLSEDFISLQNIQNNLYRMWVEL